MGNIIALFILICIIGAVIIVTAIVVCVVRNRNLIVQSKSEQTSKVVDKNGMKIMHTQIAVTPYFSLINRAEQAINDNERISYLEQALSALPGLVTDDELPPVVPPRDTLPELYMRCGAWENARETVDFCYSVGALKKDEYIERIKLIKEREAAANGLLEFLHNNPGFLQKNVYKTSELSALNHNALVWVCRSFKLIRKEKCGNTNKLYRN